MPSLDTLPREILDLILGNVCLNTQYTLLFTCRRLSTQVAPTFYRDVTLNVRKEDQNNIKSTIACFFRTVRDNQALALYVRDFSVKGHKVPTLEVGDFPAEESDKEQTNMERKDSHVRKGLIYETCDTNAVVAAILHKLENLEALHLEYPFWSENGFLPVIHQNCLKNLKHINLGIQSGPYHTGRIGEVWEMMQGSNQIGMDQLRSLMSLSLIERITCVASDDDDESRRASGFEFMPPAHNLTCLKFLGSRLTPRGLSQILHSTKNLRQLDYEFWIAGKLDEEPLQYYDCTQLDDALQPVRNTLKRLRLKVLHHGDQTTMRINRWSWRTELRGTLRSLGSFTQLTHLDIPHRLLIDHHITQPFFVTGVIGDGEDARNSVKLVDLLPRSLEYLSISTSDIPPLKPVLSDDLTYKMLLDELYDYVVARKTHAPFLEWIQIRGLASLTGNLEAIIGLRAEGSYHRLVKLCDKIGFALKLPNFSEIGEYW